MTPPTADALFQALAVTWPAKTTTTSQGWLLREGAGGGKRVSAASPVGAGGKIADAEAAMDKMGQAPLFMLRPEYTALDDQLAQRGYALRNPTCLYLAPISALAAKPPHVSLFSIWPPLAIIRDIWAQAGLGPARVAVMNRACAPKTGFVARTEDRAAGAAFCAIHDRIAMVHAVEVLPQMRRKGVGLNILRGAAHWAAPQADWMALAVTTGNTGARAMYEGAGMIKITGYHYREKGTT